MISYFVRYDGIAADPDAFLLRYKSDHADILRGFEGINGLIVHSSADWKDPFDINPGNSSLIAQMTFNSEQALATALNSQARVMARRDFEKFPRFDGTVVHQAMWSERIF